MKKGVLVFDFDGTIADSKKVYIETIHHSLLEHSFIFPKGHVARALGPKLEQTLLNLKKFSPRTLKSLKDQINKDVTKKARKLKLCAHAKDTLKRLKQEGYRIILLTNSARRFIITFLKHNKMMNYFDKLYYAENFRTKEEAIRKIAKNYNTKVKDVTYIADKIKDVKIARNAGCRIIIVLACSWDKGKFHGERYTVNSMNQLEAAPSQ